MSLELEPQISTFDDFGLDEKVLEALRKMGFVEPTPIQKKSLPLVMEGRDLLGQAQTGTGKTAAFGIPIAQRLPADSADVEALVLCPTRELAVQVAEELHEICLFTGHKVLPIYGGQRIDRQITALKKGVQVVVGTPGRILDHMGRGTLKLDKVMFLVLDEADMMLDMGFLPDIRRILRKTPPERQTLLFSATIPLDIQRISRDYMREPEFVSVVPETLTVQETEQIFYEVPEEEKIDALMRLLDYEEEGGTAMIFCRTKRNVDKLTRKLQSRGYDVEGLHGDLTQQQRDRIMAGFRENKFAYLVATDVAARGLDISHVTHVINFHIPQDPEAYVHRIGRTGRMGRAGVAITFVTPAEYWDLLRIQEFSMAQIEPGELPSAGEVEERRRAARGDEAARQRVQEADSKARRSVAIGDGEEAPAEVAASASMAETRAPSAAPAKTRRGGPRPEEAEPFVALPEVGVEPTTEAERHQRRYTLRDSKKRIEWTEASEAIKEAARIEREQLVAAVHDQAIEGVASEETEASGAALTSEQRAALESARARDLEERLLEAERLIRELPPQPADAAAGEKAGPEGEVVAEEAAGVAEEAALPPIEVGAAAQAVAAESDDEVAEKAPSSEQAEGEATPAKRTRRRKPKAPEEALAGPAEAEPEAAEAEPEAAEAPTKAKPTRRRRKATEPEEPAQPPAEPGPAELLSSEDEERIRAALGLRDRALSLVAALDQQGLSDYEAIVDRVAMDYDLRSITAALLRELAGREGGAIAPGRAGAPAQGADEDKQPSPEEAMTRLFISIGRRARLSKEGLQKLVRETAGIDESDIGRIDLLHNFAFIEVSKSVASRVIEKMHESVFKGREIQVERAKPIVKDEEDPGAPES